MLGAGFTAYISHAVRTEPPAFAGARLRNPMDPAVTALLYPSYNRGTVEAFIFDLAGILAVLKAKQATRSTSRTRQRCKLQW